MYKPPPGIHIQNHPKHRCSTPCTRAASGTVGDLHAIDVVTTRQSSSKSGHQRSVGIASAFGQKNRRDIIGIYIHDIRDILYMLGKWDNIYIYIYDIYIYHIISYHIYIWNIRWTMV